jgi:peptidyl-prolyl cis-trans isomerase C
VSLRNRENGKRGLALAGLAVFMALTAGCQKKEEEPKQETGRDFPGAQPPPVVDVGPTPADLSSVIVNVNDTKLTRKDVEDKIQKILSAQGMGGNIPPQAMASMRQKLQRDIVGAFIVRTLLAAEADRQKIEATDEDIEKRLTEMKARLPEGVSLNDVLRRYGTSEAKLREDLKEELRYEKVVETHVASLPKPTDEEIQAFYDKNPSQFETKATAHARHILFQCPAGTSEEDKSKKKLLAEATRKKLLEGADFAATAKEVSDCPSKSKGGDLGTFGQGRMVKEFETAAFSQKLNDIGPVVTTQFGYHIIQVIERTEAGKQTLDEAKEMIGQYLSDKRKQKAVQLYLEGLKKTATITYGDRPDTPAKETTEPRPPGTSAPAP